MKIIVSIAAFKGDLDTALRRLADIGVTTVDLITIGSWGLISVDALIEKFDHEVARVQAALKRYGMEAVSLNTAFSPQLFEREDAAANQARLEQVTAVCRFMRAMDIKIGAHYPGYIADWKNDPEGVRADTLISLREIQEIAREEGVTLTPEIHFKTPFEHPDDARRLLKEIPGIPYTYEPSHFIVNNHDYQSTGDLLDGAVHCHMRTSAPGQIQAAPPAGLEALDWMMARLKDRNYEGFVSIEYLPNADFDVIDAIQTIRDRYES